MTLVRTFVGIHLSEALRGRIEALTDALRRQPGGQAVRWTPKGNIHLTLRFLGDVESDALPALYAAVGRAVAPFAPFGVEVADLGCFPNTRRPNIVWAGLRGDLATLGALQGAIEDALHALGYARERRAFSPHLTIGRVNRRASRSEAAALGQTIATHGPVTLGQIAVASVSVIKSDLRPMGPIYTDLSTAPLAGRSGV
jgi:RNA 2',3'-cyclic 3'-phosphodiesterase